MYRDYREARGGAPSNDSSRSSVVPPWATDYNSYSNSYNSRSQPGGVAGHRNTSNSAAGVGGGRGRGAHERGGRRSNERRGERMPTERRYGSRPSERPYDRDLPFWLRLHPHDVPAGSISHRERENERRIEREMEDRRSIRVEEDMEVVPPEVPQKKNVLTVKAVDLHIKQNTKEHNTSEYDCTERDRNPRLVVRRGQVFILTFTFQRPWSSADDDLSLQLSLGEQANEADGTLVKIKMAEDGSNKFSPDQLFSAKIAQAEGKNLTVFVYPSPNAMIGEWECLVSTATVGSPEPFVFQGIGEIYVLFNPWCKEDQVFYTENPGDLEEYVNNEYGCVFQGQADYISRKPWFYGQFRDGVLDTCMTILRIAFDLQVSRDMGNAIEVTRRLSRALNDSEADPGVMRGNWSGRYGNGTSPSSWRSSVKILTEFGRTKSPVKYAQCWVFSHVLTTVCRALGIPCRSLTNYESAHDTDHTVTIDSYKNEDGDDMPEYKQDSTWNYHCWNDVWINRPELDSSASARGRYSGWHAIDATPQEKSAGRYQCGPTPHKAVRCGELSVGYDTGFLFGEVNGELCTWLVPNDRSRGLQLLSRDPTAVGKRMSTKKPDGGRAIGTFGPGARKVEDVRMDITHLYKFPEGSKEEREALKLAVGRGPGAKIFEEPGGVSINLVEVSPTQIGNSFTFSVLLTNTSNEPRALGLTLGVFPIDYRGERLGWDKVAFKKYEAVSISPGENLRFDLPVQDKAYLAFCDKSMSMMLRAHAKIQGEEKPVSKMKKMSLIAPDLSVMIPGPATRLERDQPFSVTIQATNPCSKPLTECSLQLDGSIEPLPSQGFTYVDSAHVKKISDIFPNQVMTLTIEVKAKRQPYMSKRRELDVDLICKQLPELTGSLEVSLS
ncbi:protein-glutamine gamma-glutamyltransferase 4 [Aplysia californica]|uniref:Protein-glutamine gamma-glutamyltransferase 4 n=1 Tax=Aplysia californica TaxID=6500 RepID=A0ABM1AFU1_APLCA|nr:protein-glutamine gamma-glutamyltransferase 4 [Aplysia californica]